MQRRLCALIAKSNILHSFPNVQHTTNLVCCIFIDSTQESIKMAIFNFATSKSFRNLNDALGRLIQPQISYSSLTTFAIARIGLFVMSKCCIIFFSNVFAL